MVRAFYLSWGIVLFARAAGWISWPWWWVLSPVVPLGLILAWILYEVWTVTLPDDHWR